MSPLKLTLALASLALAAAPLAAQGNARARGADRVPPGQLPPAGLCRIWYDDRPPGRQPQPMSCAEAQRRAPRNARVIYGPRTDRRDDGRYDDRRDGRYDGRYDDRYDDRYGRRGNREEDRRRVGEREVRRRVDGACRVRDRYGRCLDNPLGLPTMLSLYDLQRGRRTSDSYQWLGDRRLRYRYSDLNRDGYPEQIWWLDDSGDVVQYWTDRDRDGRADRVAVYRNGRVVRVVG